MSSFRVGNNPNSAEREYAVQAVKAARSAPALVSPISHQRCFQRKTSKKLQFLEVPFIVSQFF
jgi:hypothetical protein